LEQAAPSIATDAVCVLILADRGERYLDTVYSDTWVNEHFGAVSHFWKGTEHEHNERSASAVG
jgi:N-(2-amino-2-carboxyethyl)-L-glutamate synthase